ncbi:putative aminopeptidase W07G4.4 isoform X1 [Odontomachus brunneus]|uniref:putative aminopeptidase W07G4.4 isoform X1 n=1 Tax=Odontomachus brunneus TaxID=486640 RepID=UPI0013F2AB1F|nr:putative aminopeptidase W07G4.4 isoform X1 [Odontomachus brunneus]XP_032663448.1 putative aminopeptidase W07G4.4 isoform X1 [Odontomachus brunneus]XP_032663449.1 putative aminopeptidase W07G4.4 isoform X1 [Odontomachus brunneus]
MSVESRWLPCQVRVEPDICSCDYDGVILVSECPPGTNEPEPFKTVLHAAAQIDAGLDALGAVLPINLPAKRLIYSPTGTINMDYHDVRSYGEAAEQGMKRALQAGVRRPLLVLLPDERFENVEMVTLLGCLEALYVPLEVREICPERCYKAHHLGVWSPICSKKLQSIVKLASALESGRFVARDIGGADPERMAPPRVEEYLADLFYGSSVTMQVISDQDTLLQEYPLFACVNRAASVIVRHAGRIIFLTYEPPTSCVLETIMLVGKGVTYDTGGADIKCNGVMSGMSRDKCGAAACAGFMQVVNTLKPPTVKVVVALCMVRNSVGENCYVSDEVITAKSGMRVRIGNTDAEGRMAMADALYHLKEMAVSAVNPHLFTIATLTGHAVLTAGEGYSIVMDNAVARINCNAEKLQASGEVMGDPFEISRIRREDFRTHRGQAEGDDVLQALNKPSSKTLRGHQGPAAFLIRASGLDKHGVASEKPVKYSHLDIAGSAGNFPDRPTGSPILALAKAFLVDKLTPEETKDQ